MTNSMSLVYIPLLSNVALINCSTCFCLLGVYLQELTTIGVTRVPCCVGGQDELAASVSFRRFLATTHRPSSEDDDYRCNTCLACCVCVQVQLAASVSFRRFVATTWSPSSGADDYRCHSCAVLCR